MRSAVEHHFWMRWPACTYAALALALWAFPLLNVLHAESSAVVAFAGFFVAGFSSLPLFARGRTPGYVASRQIALLTVPLVLLTVSALWTPNCAYGQGLLFFLIFAPISVFFGVAVSSVLDAGRIRFKKTTFVAIGVGVSLAGVVHDFGFHSQFFTYNHVFGGILGPIYDEELTVRSGLLVFRGLTVLWAVLLLLASRGLKQRFWSRSQYVAGASLSLMIFLVYLFSAPLRLTTPTWFLQQKLGGHLATDHFDIYYDPDAVDAQTLGRIADEHAYRYAYLKERLEMDVGQRIQSYIYPDSDTKDRLTGSRATSVAPVWLREPQMHILIDHFEEVFAHELAHVFSREFGLPVLNASLSVGLVEGLAVALEPADGRPSPHEQVLTASVANTPASNPVQIDAAFGLHARLSPMGFWTGRGAVSYTTMGSFVRFLGETYGYERVKRVYAFSNFEEVYGKPIEDLVAEWEAYLLSLHQVDRSAYAYVTRRFAVPSIFEKVCPHHVPPAQRYLRDAAEALAAGDTVRTMQNLEASLAEEAGYQDALDAWAQLMLAMNRPDAVTARLVAVAQPVDTEEPAIGAGLWLRLGDAYTLAGDARRARDAYTRALDRLPLYAHQQRGLIAIRKVLADRPDWMQLLLAQASSLSAIEGLWEGETEVKGLASLVKGLFYTLDEAYDEALAAFDNLDLEDGAWTAGQRQQVERLIRILKVHLRYRVGDAQAAADEALALAASLEAVGAYNEAARYADFAAKMNYISR